MEPTSPDPTMPGSTSGQPDTIRRDSVPSGSTRAESLRLESGQPDPARLDPARRESSALASHETLDLRTRPIHAETPTLDLRAGTVPTTERERVQAAGEHRADPPAGDSQAVHASQTASSESESSPSQSSEDGPLRASDPSEVPTQLGRYTLRRAAGRGGSAVVYEAYDPHLRRTVAIKVPHQRVCPHAAAAAAQAAMTPPVATQAGMTQTLDPGLPTASAELSFSTQEGDICDILIAEARNAVAMESFQGVVRVFDIGRECGWSFIVGEWMGGGSLQDRLKQGPMPFDEACNLVADVAETLHRCHEAGWVHRDIKPANVLLDDRGRPHVADFGLVVQTDRIEPGAQTLGGTPAYMPPELARVVLDRLDGAEACEVPSDRRGDIFALGVMLYVMLAGRLWQQQTELRPVLEEILAVPVPPIRAVRPDVPEMLDRIVQKATASDPDERFTDAQTLAIKLRAAAAAVQVRDLMASSSEADGPSPIAPTSSTTPRPTESATPSWSWWETVQTWLPWGR